MVKIIVWGAGCMGSKVCEYIEKYGQRKYDVVGVTDTYKDGLDGSLSKYRFIKYDEIPAYEYDYIVVACNNMKTVEKIKEKIEADLSIALSCVVYYESFINEIRKLHLLEIYKDTMDDTLKNTMEWLKTHELTVRNQYANTKIEKYMVYRDCDQYPYVWYYGHKMFFPKSYGNIVEEKYICNIEETDQYEGSPHLYITENHCIKEGDIIVDCGVCEGNFALKYIDMASKIYLIEPDPIWIEVLKRTFEPYSDKCVFVEKGLSDVDSEKTITLDTLLKNEAEVSFIKMDIEGYETKALLGGIDTLKRLDTKLSVCTYHRKPDEKYVRFILESLGYATSASNGYMYMLYDDNIDYSNDFRRGVIYAHKA